MKAMILAAGLGQRMRPLTNHVPKPLLRVNGRPLIDYHLYKLAAAGVHEVIINHAHLGHLIPAHCGDGSHYGMRITYSNEGDTPLETAGALNKAQPLIGEDEFLLINGDTYTELELDTLVSTPLDGQLGRLVMVNNPPFHPEGDFAITTNGQLSLTGSKLTYSGVARLSPKLITDYPNTRDNFPLGEVYRYWIQEGRLRGSHFNGYWSDIGTPARLLELHNHLSGTTETRHL